MQIWWLCLLTDITVHGAVEILDIVPWPTCPEDLCRIQQARSTVDVWRLCETVRLQVDLARTGVVHARAAHPHASSWH